MIHFHLFFTAPHSSHGTNSLSTKADTASSHRQIVAGGHRKAILRSFLLGISKTIPSRNSSCHIFQNPAIFPSVSSVSILKFWALSKLLFSLRLVTTLFASGCLLQVALKNYFESSESTIQEQLLMKTI